MKTIETMCLLKKTMKFSVITLVAALPLSFSSAQRTTTSPASQPNIVLIISDDHAFEDYGFMGHPVIQTPRLDHLAQQSLLFTRGYVTTALCSPSLSTMLTGLYPHQHRTTGNDPVKGRNRQDWIEYFRSLDHLPGLLGEAGYLSLHTGKYWHGHPGLSGFTDDMGETKRHGSEVSLGIGRETMQPVYDFIDKAQAESSPFLVWYAPFMPHTPHTPPQRLLEKYVEAGPQAAYYAMIEWFDETCGQLLDYLENKGLSENTIVFYISDNGWPGSAKATPNEQGIRTPVMIRWPDKVHPRRDNKHLASNIDLVPTILAACGLEPTEEMSGINLLDRVSVANRDVIFAENFLHDMIDMEQPAKSLRARSCITKDWKLTVWQDPQPDVKLPGWQTPAPEDKIVLINLKKDPMETTNLADNHPKKVVAMKKQLNNWWNPDE
jgi:arylsulfatase A-like enzyme